MAAAVEEFSVWLGNKLQALNTDENVFGSYITGILDGDETLEEKTEAIQEILTEIIESDISVVCKEIIEMWQKAQPKEIEPNASATSAAVDEKLVRLLESQSLTTTVQREYTAEERKIREAILSQYSQMTDEEDDGEEAAGGGGSGGGGHSGVHSGGGGHGGDSNENGIERNTNFFSVQQAEKEKREQAKIDSQKKKEKDKEDREKQKQAREEKKEKRKTQKGERRR